MVEVLVRKLEQEDEHFDRGGSVSEGGEHFGPPVRMFLCCSVQEPIRTRGRNVRESCLQETIHPWGQNP
jgi:hypothetical protein